MAGHSKWANTKHRKAAQDFKRGKNFTKIIRELVTAAKLGGSDINANPRLRTVIDKALFNNMSRDTVNRAIARGISSDNNINMDTTLYEGYGPGGSAIIVKCLSDNRNRTAAEVRHAFTKTGGHLVTSGSVSYLFVKKGVISYSKVLDEDTLIYTALEAGADDVITYDGGAIDVITPWKILNIIQNTLYKNSNLIAELSEISMIPFIKIKIDSDNAFKLMNLINLLEDSDDVQAVYHNCKVPVEVINTMA
ncbi:YebC/PmpR family DNA-binding transcriptional regulator [Candidatus Profftia sp. (ex Adelges kitamiensis)]|uniref:YebC/PmpR family DNA-binding transcriptional regulator n=1 Tax=Candidatus Profftia sp. (ex Adelges kitamiensis) TaxID=2864218 RepID=UPI001CE34796|nr:YebC/PmpR family DNA-binding transcriptional regulator [Candidatus Profftia sp. (ex Adelges kitamiensis)]